MIFAKVDVELRDHERAAKAGAAMATWLWGLLWSRAKLRDGFVSTEAIRGAFVGEKQAMRDMAKLVSVGLAEITPDGWLLVGYSDKNETRDDVEERQRDQRERKARSRETWAKKNRLVTRESHVTSPVTAVVTNAGVTGTREPEPEPEPERGERGGAPEPPEPKRVFPDPLVKDGFAAGLLEAGHRVSPASFAAKDLSEAAAAHWPEIPASKRAAAIQRAAVRWARQADERTRNSGFRHLAFIDWLNAGNAKEITHSTAPPKAPKLEPITDLAAHIAGAELALKAVLES